MPATLDRYLLSIHAEMLSFDSIIGGLLFELLRICGCVFPYLVWKQRYISAQHTIFPKSENFSFFDNLVWMNGPTHSSFTYAFPSPQFPMLHNAIASLSGLVYDNRRTPSIAEVQYSSTSALRYIIVTSSKQVVWYSSTPGVVVRLHSFQRPIKRAIEKTKRCRTNMSVWLHRDQPSLFW